MDNLSILLLLAVLILWSRGRDSQPTVIVNQPPQQQFNDGCASTLAGLAILAVVFFGFIIWAAA